MSASGDSGIFLWGGAGPAPTLSGFSPRSDKWWTQYRETLRVSPRAIQELSRTSREIAALLPDPLSWGDKPSPFKGVVVGAVQSGKTASMMGLCAVALDQGYRVVIVLAGGKDDLRQQTARRFNTQLVRQSDLVPGTLGLTTMGRPKSKGPLGGFALPYSVDANQFGPIQIRMEAAIRNGEPCILVIKKNVASLRDTQNALRYLYTTFGAEALPTLVLDDECDDASVDSSPDAVIPAAIGNLWHVGTKAPQVAYVGYTATAAANLLQSAANELYPSHFVYLLRYPGVADSPIEYAEPISDGWYSGGYCFYEAFGEEPGENDNFLIVPTIVDGHLAVPVRDNLSLRDALRAYFVAGAYRLALAPDKTFGNANASPAPHTMLVQTSAETEEHARWAKGIQQMLGGEPVADRTVRFSAEHLSDVVSGEENLWHVWFARFDSSRERLYQERPHPGVHSPVTWTQVKERLRDVFEHTRLKVVNSDPVLRSELDYAPRLTASGEVQSPQDVYVIVVGGSKLSRGITLEGLTITYFARWSTNPTEDTVLQLSRWLGYRGPFLEFCRVVVPQRSYEELRQMSENDLDLRFQLADLMQQSRTPEEATMVLKTNPRSLPTAKLGEGVVYQLAFSPHTIVLPHIETGSLEEANESTALRVVARVRERRRALVRTATGVVKGELSNDWSAEEIADFLDSLQFTEHNPDETENPHREFYRKADCTRPRGKVFSLLNDPYQVAAYLRAWSRDRGRNSAAAPRFNVGVAYGEMSGDCAPFDFPLTNRQVSESNRVIGGWGGRSANWDGDAYFDQPPENLRAPGTYGRLEGAEGLLLLYVIHKDAVGRSGSGTRRSHHSPVFGISIPSGGPPYKRVVT